MLTLIHNNKEHANVSELLPWYVNQTLTQVEQAMVEKHISVCETCQQDINLLQSTFAASNDVDSLAMSCDEQFKTLMQRIEGDEDSQQSPQTRHPKQNTTALSWYQNPPMAIAASFLGAMLMLYWASPFFPGNIPGDTNDYQVLTTVDTTAIELEVTFESNTNEADARGILSDADTRFSVNDSHPTYRFNLPSDYDVVKISELVKTLSVKNQIANVKIVRENE